MEFGYDFDLAEFIDNAARVGIFVAGRPAWTFAAPGAASIDAAIAVNPAFFQAHPAALNPNAGLEVINDDPDNPWKPVSRRKIRRAGPGHGGSEVIPPPPEVKVTKEIPWSAAKAGSRRYVRKHFVARKGGRSNMVKDYQARKGGYGGSPDGPGKFTYGSYGPGGTLEF